MAIQTIASPHNATFKMFLKLRRSKGIKKHAMALFWGSKQIREVMEHFPEQCEGIIVEEGHLPGSFPSPDLPVYSLPAKLFRQIDLFDTKTPVLLIKVLSFPRWDDRSWRSGCTLCVPFQDPSNVGAVIRSAAAFGVSRVLVLEEAAHPFHPKAVRAAGSTLFRVPLWKGPPIDQLRVCGVPAVTLSPEGRDVEGFRFPESFCLIPGLEGPGLPEGFRNDTSLAIPMAPGVDSLNAAMATGIVLYRWRRSLEERSALGQPRTQLDPL